MDKVYFKNEIGFFVEELTDIYYFLAQNIETGEKSQLILSWHRGQEIPEDSNIIRVYDIEIDEEKIFFFMTTGDSNYIFEPKSKLELDKFLSEKNLLLVGEVIN